SIDKLTAIDEPFVLSQVTGEDGTVYIGTGNEGKIYRLRDGSLELLFDSDEQQIHALDVHGNTLYAGSSPHGHLYEIDLRSGASEKLADIDQAYIWEVEALDESELLVATGLDAKLLRVSGGDVSVLFDVPETHLRSIVVKPDGAILAGGSGEGRIYEISEEGKARALYDSSLTEISALYFDLSTGSAWAAGGKSVLPTSAPQQQQQQKQSGSDQQQDGESESSSGESSVSVSFSFDQQAAITQPTGSSELYRIHSDGHVETVWRLEREIIYSIDRAAGSGIIVSTGANGRIYRVIDEQVALIAQLPEKQVVAYRARGDQAIATTTNAGAVFELAFPSTDPASFRSDVKDTGRLSRFGEYLIEGRNVPRDVTMFWRSGNTSSPDETWSEWERTSGVSGSVAAPSARYLQWKLEASGPPRDMVIEEVSSVFINRNVAPKIEAFEVAEPAVVFLSGGYPTPPGILEATNPDQYGIFTSIDTPESPDTGKKKYFRKGYRTVKWKTSDENGDELRHDLHFRPRSSGEWLRLRENIDGDEVNFDTTQLPDGEYELRLTVRDARSNPVEAKTTERAGLFFTVDNTAPDIRTRKSGGDTIVTIEDDASPVAKVEYSVDAEEWNVLLPEDGISDSRSEIYRIDGENTKGRFVIVRAVDAFYNVATTSVE
ncbi:MAG: hypothetical protein R3338_02555, partial [Thermoanaerobaculia bacterium]|nr:hypothetical protein [Thermoanaerobaculia bacterium]